MNREEFLRQLEQLLSGISEEERADAMAFYRSYFEDAGAENEPLILEELESPQKVAESIMKNLGIDGSSGYYNTFANRDAEYYRNLRESEVSEVSRRGAALPERRAKVTIQELCRRRMLPEEGRLL